MKTPIGYVVTLLIQSIELYAVVFIWLCTILIPVAHCVFIIAFCSDLENDMRILNEIIKIENDKKKKFRTIANNGIMEKLIKILRFYGNVKQLSEYELSIT